MSRIEHSPEDHASHGNTSDRSLDPGRRRRIPTGARWAAEVGYCRALRQGNRILVSGTAPVADDGSTFAPGDAEAQARRCLEIIAGALAALDAGMEHVVRTRIYVTDISQWEAVGRAHGDAFRQHPPTTTMVEVRGLIAPDMLVEIEAEAWLDD
jgi:enamine deaminase RidA (YjgF/YER057c/UK114 family)